MKKYVDRKSERSPDEKIVEDTLADCVERSFADLEKQTKIGAWELCIAVGLLQWKEAVTTRVDLSTGRWVRLYRSAC